MRYMMLMLPAGYETAPPEIELPADAVERMMKYNQAMHDAGILVAMDGLRPPSAGARVSFSSGKPVVTDGPFAEAKEVLGGYWIIDVPTLQDAIEWAKRCPGSTSETIEIRPLQTTADFRGIEEIVAAYPQVTAKRLGRP